MFFFTFVVSLIIFIDVFILTIIRARSGEKTLTKKDEEENVFLIKGIKSSWATKGWSPI